MAKGAVNKGRESEIQFGLLSSADNIVTPPENKQPPAPRRKPEKDSTPAVKTITQPGEYKVRPGTRISFAYTVSDHSTPLHEAPVLGEQNTD